jgi:hypothetical protein
VCERAAARDERITYIRQPVNLGMAGNFTFVSELGNGPFFMYLADDDWLDETFLERCVAVLDGRPDVVLACGALRVYEGDRYVGTQPAYHLTRDVPLQRVLGYYGGGASTWTYYGLRRLSAHRRASPVPNYRGSDKSETAALAYLGKLVMVPGTHYNRVRGSLDALDIAEKVGIDGFGARHPTLTFVGLAFADIGWRLDTYEELSRPARLGLGLTAMTVWMSSQLIRRRLIDPARRARSPLRKAYYRARRRFRQRFRPVIRRVRRLQRAARSRARRLRRGVRRSGRRVRRRVHRLSMASQRTVGRTLERHRSDRRWP